MVDDVFTDGCARMKVLKIGSETNCGALFDTLGLQIELVERPDPHVLHGEAVVLQEIAENIKVGCLELAWMTVICSKCLNTASHLVEKRNI